MIISGGENVYSAEVENAINTHPGVALVAVIGVPHELWGEAVHAVIVPQEGFDLSERDIIDHARRLIGGYKVPKSVEFTDDMPLDPLMKPLKRKLRRRHLQRTTEGTADAGVRGG